MRRFHVIDTNMLVSKTLCGPNANPRGPNANPRGSNANHRGLNANPRGPNANTRGSNANPRGPNANTRGPTARPNVRQWNIVSVGQFCIGITLGIYISCCLSRFCLCWVPNENAVYAGIQAKDLQCHGDSVYPFPFDFFCLGL